MITVFASGDWGDLAAAKLLLEGEGIPFVTVGEGVQDLFGMGRVFVGFNPITGPVQLRVRDHEAERAAELLRDITEQDQAKEA